MEAIKTIPEANNTIKVMSITIIRGDDNIIVQSINVDTQEGLQGNVSFQSILDQYTPVQQTGIKQFLKKIAASYLEVNEVDVVGEFE